MSANSQNLSLRFEDVRFRAHIREHEQTTFIGYADATLVAPSVLPDGSDLKLRIRGIEVKLTSNGPRIDFKSEKGRDGSWYPVLFPKSAESRTALTVALLADPTVRAVVDAHQERFAAQA